MAIFDIFFLHCFNILPIQRFFDQQVVKHIHSFFHLKKAAQQLGCYYLMSFFDLSWTFILNISVIFNLLLIFLHEALQDKSHPILTNTGSGIP
jgi:hypothetical protein